MNYYKVVNYIFLVTVLIFSITIAYIIKVEKSVVEFPPRSSPCPDYWSLDPSGDCIVNPSYNNIGNCSFHPAIGDTSYQFFNMDPYCSAQHKDTIVSGTISHEELQNYVCKSRNDTPTNAKCDEEVDFPRKNFDSLSNCDKQKWARKHEVAWSGINDIDPSFCFPETTKSKDNALYDYKSYLNDNSNFAIVQNKSHSVIFNVTIIVTCICVLMRILIASRRLLSVIFIVTIIFTCIYVLMRILIASPPPPLPPPLPPEGDRGPIDIS